MIIKGVIGMKKKPEKKVPIGYYDVIKHFLARDSSFKTKQVEYFGTTHRYGKPTRKGGGYYQSKSNPYKKLSMDEVKLRKGVASYYFWGKRVAKWDGETLWLDNGGMESIEVSRRLVNFYQSIVVYGLSKKEESKEADADVSSFTFLGSLKKTQTKLTPYGGVNKNIVFHPEGYTLGATAHIINPYPITLCVKTKKILDFTEEQKDMYVSKLLRSRGPRGTFILNTIKSFGLKLTDEEKAQVKVKQLKILMDDKIDKEFLADLDDLPDLV